MSEEAMTSDENLQQMKAHVAAMQKHLNHAKGIYDNKGERFSVNPQTFLWRTRYQGIYLFSMMGLWLQQHPTNAKYGATITKWRAEFPKVGALVTRTIIATGAIQEEFMSQEIEVSCKQLGAAGLSSVKEVIARGVDLGLLEARNGNTYALTQMCIREAFDRVMWKMMTPEIIEFCRYVTMFDDMRKIARTVGEREQSGVLGTYTHRSLNEEFYFGSYNSAIFGDDDAEGGAGPAAGS